MTQPSYQHDFQIGDAVLADMNGARIPGVATGKDDVRILVRLAQPWTDETGQAADIVALSPDKLDTYINEETGGQAALPG